jgi:nitroreductase
MDIFEAMQKRASVRAFESAGPEAGPSEEDLMRIVDAGRRAPSGYNRQPREFVLVTDPETLKRLGEVQGCIADAHAAVAVVADEAASDYWKEDCAASIENMLLASVALGYASLWVEGYVLRHEGLVKDMLGIPDELRAIAVLPIGVPAGAPEQAAKKPLDEVLHRETYDDRK